MSTNAQTILITGATTGIGRHAALYLARAGHRVIASGRNTAALATLRAEAQAQGVALDTVRLDVTDRASIAAAAREIDALTQGRGVDALVNNAGYGIVAPVIETPEAEMRGQYETNVFGLMAVTQAFAPRMMARGAGRIVNISSGGGRVTLPLFGAYNSTKYAVESLSDAMRRELHAFGVKVVLIEPGPIATEFANTSVQSVGRHQNADSRYAALFAHADRMKQRADAMSAQPIVVTRAIERAITASRPAARYVVPFSTRIGLFFAELLPTVVLDWVMRRAFGLTPRALALASGALAATTVAPGATSASATSSTAATAN